MAIVEIIYEAKCKHCLHFNSERKVKKDGTLSLRRRYYCSINVKKHDLTIKEKACDSIKL